MLADTTDSNQEANFYIIKELRHLIDRDKYIIIDLNLKKTVKALKGSCKFGPKGEHIGYKIEKQANSNYDYAVEFKPTCCGRYRVDIENFNEPINRSPFFISVYDPQAAFVKVRPNNLIIGCENIIEG